MADEQMTPKEVEPEWLRRWRQTPLSRTKAMKAFLDLSAIAPEEIVGTWKGTSLPSGHPFDSLLEYYGWAGKRLYANGAADPLLFYGDGGYQSINPRYIPVHAVLRASSLTRWWLPRLLFSIVRPLLRTTRPTARVVRVELHGTESAAIAYDKQPIMDHLRAIDHDTLVGLMAYRFDDRPFFFLLERAHDGYRS